MSRYSRAYAAKYSRTFDNPSVPLARDEREWIPRPGMDYGPKFWELVRAYASRAWTDAQGQQHYVLTNSRFPELEQAYAEHVKAKEAKP